MYTYLEVHAIRPLVHDEESEGQSADEDGQVGDALEEVPGDVVEHDADAAPQGRVPDNTSNHV